MGLSFPTSAALVAGREGKVATSAGLLLAANTLGAIVGTFVVPFFVIPAIGSPDAIGVIALINVVLGIALRGRRRSGPRPGASPRTASGGWRRPSSPSRSRRAGSSSTRAWRGSSERNGELFASDEDEIASVQAGNVGGYPGAVGDRHVDDPADRRCQAHADPAADRPAGVEDALVVAFGMGSAFRSGVIAGLQTDAVELVPSRRR